MMRKLLYIFYCIAFLVPTYGQNPLIDTSKIRAGGPPPDGIPSIDNPMFETVSEADEWLRDDELVVVLRSHETVRMYPLDILVWHEIVNDTVDSMPVLITYCPLCGSAIAFERVIDGNPVEFGTSGKLYNSNLIMYDRQTESYWTQIGGQAVMGSLTGLTLEPVSINTVRWGDWKTLYPDAEVLSRQTGYSRQYGRDPYGDYYTDSRLMFPVENRDDRLHTKEIIYGIELDGKYKAYPEKVFQNQSAFKDEVAGISITIEHDGNGAVRFSRDDNGNEIVKERAFWFAWVAFYPETALFSINE